MKAEGATVVGPTADRGTRDAWVIAGLVFGAVLAGLWPTREILRGDDFGYSESAVVAIRSGVGTQSEWLDPLSFVLSALLADFLRVGDSFCSAMLGLAVLGSPLKSGLVWCWLRVQIQSARWGDATAVAVTLEPAVLNEIVGFTGRALGWSFVFGARCACWARPAGRRALHCSGEHWRLVPVYRPRLFPLNDEVWCSCREDGRR